MNIAEWILALFGGSMAKLVFASIFSAGMVVTLFKLIMGADSDHGDHGDVHADHGGDFDGSPGLFSVTGMTFMLTGYGGVAFIIQHFTNNVVFSSFGGLLGGWPFSLLMLWLYRIFLSQQASSLVKTTDFTDAIGTVDIVIRADQPGEVILVVAGRQVTKLASANGAELPRGTAVRVTQYLGDRVIVERIA